METDQTELCTAPVVGLVVWIQSASTQFNIDTSCRKNALFILTGCKLTPGRAADRSGFQTPFCSRLLPYLIQLQAVAE